jgi:hypothetical protein
VLAGADDANKTLDSVVGKSERAAADTAIREAFVSALGTALKISAGLVLAGLVLTLLLMRRQDPVDDDEPAEGSLPPVAAPPHRPLGRHPHWGLPFRRGPPATS